MKVKRALIKGTNWALAGLIGLLGFTNCDRNGLEEYGPPRMEYGVPYADYVVKGTVVDKATGKPIPGIRIGYDPIPSVGPMYGVLPKPYSPKTSVTTNATGEYELKDKISISEMIPDEKNIPTYIPVFVNDIDGKQNGLYSDTILKVNAKDAVYNGKSKGWYKGEYTVKVNVELTEREGNE